MESDFRFSGCDILYIYWAKKGKNQFHPLTLDKIWVDGVFAFVRYYYLQIIEHNN